MTLAIPTLDGTSARTIDDRWRYVVHELSSFSSGKSAQDIDRRLWLELTPEQYQLVRELIRLELDAPVPGLDDETERVVEALAAHFPAFGPAIRAVAQHLIDQGVIYEDVSPPDCCRGLGGGTMDGQAS